MKFLQATSNAELLFSFSLFLLLGCLTNPDQSPFPGLACRHCSPCRGEYCSPEEDVPKKHNEIQIRAYFLLPFLGFLEILFILPHMRHDFDLMEADLNSQASLSGLFYNLYGILRAFIWDSYMFRYRKKHGGCLSLEKSFG